MNDPETLILQILLPITAFAKIMHGDKVLDAGHTREHAWPKSAAPLQLENGSAWACGMGKLRKMYRLICTSAKNQLQLYQMLR